MKTFRKWLLVGAVAAPTIPIGVLLYPELKRMQLLERYSPSIELTRRLQTPGTGNLSSLAQSGETMVCALDSYGSLVDLKGLSALQRQSLSKDMLPSEDGTWFLIFLSNDSVERVAAIRPTADIPFGPADAGCAPIRSLYSISQRLSPSGEPELVFALFK